MADGSIEILGQKLAYPTTWQGAAAVLIVCTALTVIAHFARGWATPEVIKGLAGLASTSKEQESINQSLLTNIEQLSAKIAALEKAAVTTATKPTDSSASKEAEAAAAVARRALEQQFAISKLREQLANQSLIRLQQVAPVIQPEASISQQVQQVQQVQQQQQQQQQQIQQQIQKER